MNLVLGAEPVPLRQDKYGTIRVGRSRVSFDTVIFEFRQGSTPEQIAEDYATLKLADIYGAIAYYLRHQDEVEAYLTQRREEAEALRCESESRDNPVGTLARLIARRGDSTSP